MPAAGPRALALAVYGDGDGQLVTARGNGLEGVACVDDAARAFVLLCGLWNATGNAALRTWAEGFLEFLLWMRASGGRWINFISDWEGTRNATGITSKPGVNFWQARATSALVEAALLLGNQAAREALWEELAAAASAPCAPDVRALHVLAATRLLRAQPNRWLSAQLRQWVDEISDCHSGDVLKSFAEESGQPHLWGHVQEAALIEAAALLERDDLQKVAVRSAESVFTQVIESGFDLPHVQPYDVQSAVVVMDSLGVATGNERYLGLAQAAREWFDGRNPAGAPTYDRTRGWVSDGIDDRRISAHSGAEANITGGLALIGDPGLLAIARTWDAGGSQPAM